MHLQDDQGQVVAQRDSEPLAGIRPMTGWQPGQIVEDRVGLWLPVALAEGEYRLLLGLYDPESGDRLDLCCPAGDALPLATLWVTGEEAVVQPLD